MNGLLITDVYSKDIGEESEYIIPQIKKPTLYSCKIPK